MKIVVNRAGLESGHITLEEGRRDHRQGGLLAASQRLPHDDRSPQQRHPVDRAVAEGGGHAVDRGPGGGPVQRRKRPPPQRPPSMLRSGQPAPDSGPPRENRSAGNGAVGLGASVFGLGSWVLGLRSWVFGLGASVLGLPPPPSSAPIPNPQSPIPNPSVPPSAFSRATPGLAQFTFCNLHFAIYISAFGLGASVFALVAGGWWLGSWVLGLPPSVLRPNPQSPIPNPSLPPSAFSRATPAWPNLHLDFCRLRMPGPLSLRERVRVRENGRVCGCPVPSPSGRGLG